MSVPDFDFTRFYYPDLLAGLIERKAVDLPEHTETDPHDGVVQLYRSLALVGHQQASRLDHTALELLLTTLKLRSSMIGLAGLVDYQLAPAVPAEADVLGDVSGTLTAADVIVQAYGLVETGGTSDNPPIVFERNVATDLVALDGSGVYTLVEDDAGVVTIRTTPTAALWGGAPVAGDALIFGNRDAGFNKLGIEIGTANALIDFLRWEYYDNLRVLAPDSVTDLGGTIRFDVSELVGSVTKSDGLSVTVTCLRTGVSETLATTSSGDSQRVTTAGTLGQAVVSTTATDYTVQTDWPELPSVVDGTLVGGVPLAQDGDVTFVLPEGIDRRWGRWDPTVHGEGLWVRARVVAVTAGAAPAISALTEPRRTVWTTSFPVSQGRRVEDRVGTTTGVATETFTLGRGPFLSLVSLTVGGVVWGVTESLLTATTWDRVFELREQPDATWEIRFGDGTQGKIPAAAQAVVATYRIGGGQSGNVGANAIERRRGGAGKLRNIRNPRPATGWVVQQATTPASLEAARRLIPASLRARKRAVTPDDYVSLATAFRAADGTQVAARALAIEEGYGPKTMQVVCVGPGGIAPTAADLAELAVYFNGNTAGLQRIGGVAPSNTTVTCDAYTPLTVAVTATVTVLADFATGAKSAIEARLNADLQPLALALASTSDDDYRWAFGGTVGLSALLTSITLAVPHVVSIVLTVPAADVALASDELPVPGTLAITVVAL